MKIETDGYAAYRLRDDNPREVAFATAWKKENQRPEGNKQLLEYLVECPTPQQCRAAATVIQWLGSNVGACFLADVLNNSPEMVRYLRATVKGFSTSEVREKVKPLVDGLVRLRDYPVSMEPVGSALDMQSIAGELIDHARKEGLI